VTGAAENPMTRLVFIVACGFVLTACSGSMPSFGLLSPAPEQLLIESTPAGAEARSSDGSTCQTPCEFAMPSGSDFSVTVTMNGYQPVTVPVGPGSPGGKLQPNPVYVELQPSAPRAPAKKNSGKRKARQAAAIQQQI
jgi:hypothetical protein